MNRLACCGFVVSALALVAADLHAVMFTDVTASAGILHRHYDRLPVDRQVEPYMTGGAAAGDFDGDGWTDLYFTRLDNTDLLYRNLGDGTFLDVTEAAFGENHLADLQTNGAAWGDIDNDHDLDLFVTSHFSNRYHLFVNDGRGGFTEQAIQRGAAVTGDDTHFGFSATFGDYDRDGYLDLHVTEWRAAHHNPSAARHNTRLLRNLGATAPGHFVDVTEAAGVAMERVQSTNPRTNSQSFTSRFTDLDADGFPDLAIASDHGTSRLFWNNGDGTFSDGTAAAGVGTDQFGMGSAVGDIDADGDLDWLVTSIYRAGQPLSNGNRLYRNEGQRVFRDATDAAGVRDGGWGWGAAMFDFDNDGDLDIAQANGQQFNFSPAVTTSIGFEHQPIRLWQNNGAGVFDEVALDVGLTDTGSGKGLLTLDYDNDGDLDLLIVNNADAPVLYRNDGGNENQFLSVELAGRRHNTHGVGALVTIDPNLNLPGDEQLREIDAGSHFLGQSPSLANFGLGPHTGPIDRVTVRWTSGAVTTLVDVAPNQHLTIAEPVPEPTSWLLIVAALGMPGRLTLRLPRVTEKVASSPSMRDNCAPKGLVSLATLTVGRTFR